MINRKRRPPRWGQGEKRKREVNGMFPEEKERGKKAKRDKIIAIAVVVLVIVGALALAVLNAKSRLGIYS